MTPMELIAALLMLAGTFFVLLASVGVVRLPDVYCRLSATSKAVPFGVGLLLAGAALAMGDAVFALQSLAIAVFLALTSPVAAHALGRAAHDLGVVPWRNTLADDETSAPDRSGEL